MIIGVDARPLSRPLTGIGRYTFEMCSALSHISEITLHLYSPSPIPAENLIGMEKVVVQDIHWNNGVLRQVWSESFLPLWAAQSKVDVFWGPAHRLPRLLPKSIARVVTIHDLVWRHAGATMRPISRALERLQMPSAVRSADVIAVDSTSTGNDVAQEFGMNADKMEVIYPGTHAQAGPVVPENEVQTFGTVELNKPYFLFVGTLEPRKNLSRLLEAYAQLDSSARASCPLVIVGGKGWGGVDLQQKIDTHHLAQSVKVLGFVGDEALAVLYAKAQFLAMPSLYEGFGLPLIEAMAHGTPVLTSDNSSMPEVAGKAGLLVEAENVASIAKGLNSLIVDEQLRKNLSSHAKENAARFNWETSAHQLAQTFEKAIAARKSRLSEQGHLS